MEQRTSDNPKDWDKPVNVNQPDQKFEQPNQPQRTETHPVVASQETLKHSGKHVEGGPSEDIISVHPTSRPQQAPKKKWDVEPKVIHDLSSLLIEPDFASPYDVTDLEVGSGLFIVTEPNQTVDELMDKVNNEVLRLNEYWSVPAHNDRGEEILDQVTVKEFKRNNDGTIQLGGDDKPFEGAMFTQMLRRIQIRQYVAKSVTADVDNDQIDDDGALIVRVF